VVVDGVLVDTVVGSVVVVGGIGSSTGVVVVVGVVVEASLACPTGSVAAVSTATSRSPCEYPLEHAATRTEVSRTNRHARCWKERSISTLKI